MLDAEARRAIREQVSAARQGFEVELDLLRAELEELREDLEDVAEMRLLRGAGFRSRRPAPPAIAPVRDAATYDP